MLFATTIGNFCFKKCDCVNGSAVRQEKTFLDSFGSDVALGRKIIKGEIEKQEGGKNIYRKTDQPLVILLKKFWPKMTVIVLNLEVILKVFICFQSTFRNKHSRSERGSSSHFTFTF